MLKKFMLPFFAAAVLAPVALMPAQAQVSIDTPVLDVNVGDNADMLDTTTRVITQPAVVQPASTCSSVLTQPAVVAPASACSSVLTQPAVVEPVSTSCCSNVLTQPAVVEVPMQHYRVLQYPAVTAPVSSLSCPGIIEQHAVVAPQPRLIEFDVPMPRIEEHRRFGGLGMLNPLNWF